MIKIKLLVTICDAYALVFSDFGRLFRIGGIWFIGVIVVIGVVALLLLTIQATATVPNLRILLIAAPLFFLVGALMAFQVASYRVFLRAEILSPISVLRFGQREIRFFLYFVVVWLAILVPPLVVAVALYVVAELSGTSEPSSAILAPAAGLILSVSFLAALILGSRLFLVLPAVAVDERRGLISRAWRRGRGNTQSLFLGPIIAALPAGIVAELLNAVGPTPSVVVRFVLLALSLLGDFVAIALGVAFLSLAYKQLSTNTPENVI